MLLAILSLSCLIKPGVSHFPEDTGMWYAYCYSLLLLFDPLDQEKQGNTEWDSLEAREKGAEDSRVLMFVLAEL